MCVYKKSIVMKYYFYCRFYQNLNLILLTIFFQNSEILKDIRFKKRHIKSQRWDLHP